MKKKILSADILTPILAYMRVQGDHKVILESIPREKENARFQLLLTILFLKSNLKMGN